MTCNDDALEETTDPDYLLEYIEISDVDEISGLKTSETLKFRDAPSRARRRVNGGDVIVSTVRTYLRAVAAISNPEPNTIVSTGFAVLRPQTIKSKFARYAILSDGFISEVIARSKGISYPAITATDLVRICMPVPSEAEQITIGDYLDIEIARIDTLIQEKEELIGLLQEAQSSIFASTALKISNTASGQKSERLPWLAKLPTTWQLKKIKHLVLSVDQGISPQCESYPPEEDQWGVLKVGCVNTGQFDRMESKALPVDIEPIESITLKKGDVLVSRANTKNLVGRAAMADQDYPRLMMSDKHYRLRLDTDACEPQYMVFVLTHPAVRVLIEERATGASASMLNIDRRTIMDLDIPLPPLSIQQQLIREVENQRNSLSALITHAQEEITLLKELRAATIADAVLGRVDVRTAAHP